MSDLLRFHLKKNKQGFKETRTRKTDVICLFWDQCDSHLSFKTFLSAPLALSSFLFFSYTNTWSLRPLESLDNILFKRHVLVIDEDEVEHSEVRGRSLKENEVAML